MAYDVTIAETGPRGLIAVRASPAGAAAVSGVLGVELPADRRVASAGRLQVLHPAADEWLIATDPADAAAVFEQADTALGGRLGATAVVTDAYRGFSIDGADTLHVMAQALAVDLDPGAFAPGTATRTAFGRASALVHRLDESRFEVHVDVTLARYATLLLAVCREPGDTT